jgi:hypothetical protein
MEKKEKYTYRTPRAQIFDCESEPIPPGTKSRGRLLRGDEQPYSGPGWWLFGGAVVVALLIGVVVGRFLLV